MKILKTLGLVLCFSCAPEGFSSESNPIERSIFTEVDLELARLYPGTLKGYEAIVDDEHIINAARRLDGDFISISAADVIAVRSYYFSKFFTFMDGLRKRNPESSASEEFNTLFENMWEEAQQAAKEKLSDLNWHMIQVMFIRGLLLASGEGEEGARDLLSIVPETELFFGALRDAPTYLRTVGEPILPAWKHSAKACLHNMHLPDTKGKDVHLPYVQMGNLNWNITDEIEKTASRLGLHENVSLPMLDCGKIGITTIMKMWLHHVFPVPLTYGEYEAHGIKLGAAVGAEHDEAHGNVDNCRREMMQFIVNLLNNVLKAGKPVKKAIPLATQQMVDRYQAFNRVLLAFIDAKERTAISELQAAMAIAPEDKDNVDRKAAEKLARQKYNTGVSALFQALHEAYAMKANVLETPTFAEAIAKLCENAKASQDEEFSQFDEFQTFFNTSSDLTNEEIFEKIKTRTLASVKIYPGYNGSTPAPTKIGEYVDHIDLESLKVNRGPVITEVRFDTNNGQTVKIQTPTTSYLVGTIRDENAVLGLVGKKVPDITLDMEVLRALPKDAPERVEALLQVKTWIDTIVANVNEMVTGLGADVLANTPEELIAEYDALVATQNIEWQTAYPIP